MAEPELDPEHNFANHCSGTQGKDFSDEQDGYHQPPWLFRDAFAPTMANPNVSGNWIERETGTFAIQLQRIQAELASSKRTVRKTHQIAVVPVKTIMRLGLRYSRNLHVIFCPDEEQKLPSHAEIRGILPDDRILQQKLADNATIFPIL